MSHTGVAVLLFLPFSRRASSPSAPSGEVGIERSVLQHRSDVAIRLNDHCRSDKRFQVRLGLLLIPDEVMTVESDILRHVGKHGIDRCPVHVSTVSNNSIHLQRITGSKHLEILIGESLIRSGLLRRLVIHRRAKSQSHKHIRCVLSRVSFYRLIVGKHLLYGQWDVGSSNLTLSGRSSPLHYLVVATG